MILGHATIDGTLKLAKRFKDLEYTMLGTTDLRVSQCGFGCYRVDISIDTHKQAMEKALKEGINIIDTSSNYGNGGSEKLVGTVIDDLIEERDIKRNEIVIVSKGGYIQGENFNISQQRKSENNPFKDLVEYAEGLEHCIHPGFLDDQITRSLKRLFIETIDVYLLHNPEYYLGWAKQQNIPIDKAREEYYRRIEEAFKFLESKVEEGKIQCYGISSNTFPRKSSDPEFTSLEKVWDIAESISKDHHFRVIQLPINLFERGAVIEKNQSEKETLIQFAHKKKLAILCNRPLNAVLNNKLIRLAGIEPAEPVSTEEVEKEIADLLASEEKFNGGLVHSLNLGPQIKSQLTEYISPGEILKSNWKNFVNYTQWYEVLTQYLSPRINLSVNQLTELEPLPMAVSYWMENHVDQIQRVFKAIDAHYKAEAVKITTKIKEITSNADEDWKSAKTLSQMAIRALRSTEGISTILLGMRETIYVDDALTELKTPVEVQPRLESWGNLEQNLKASEF